MNVEQKKTDEIVFETLPSDELIDYISFKEEYPEEAAAAFTEFCSRFERDILQKQKYIVINLITVRLLHLK